MAQTSGAGGPSLIIQDTTHRLEYYIGSATNARSFLLSVDGFLYEAPVTWYAKPARWDLSPGYQSYSYPYLTRAIPAACLDCHASGVQPIPGTQNGYAPLPFPDAGISCERCHGPGDRHASTGRREDIVNPARLAPDRRDSVCSQCHLSGDIRIERAGKHQHDFTPGDRLYDYSVAFVRNSASPRMRVTSHVENLAQSACARASGDRLWCGSCHDPHSTPAPAEKAAWFRGKCQGCHTTDQCSRGPDCVACHMPTMAVADADHVVYTDHSIPRRPTPRNSKPPADAPLSSFGTRDDDPRDLGLAYAIVALRENSAAYRERAFDLLREANAQTPDEPQTLAYLAELYKGRSDDKNARRLYERLVKIDPAQSAAWAALGAYEMEAGRAEEAIRLWREALRISPALVLVRYNLALALMQTGHRDEARAMLEKTLEFNPSFTAARKLLDGLTRTNE